MFIACCALDFAGEFVDSEENLLIYTDLFQQYTQLVGELATTVCEPRVNSCKREWTFAYVARYTAASYARNASRLFCINCFSCTV